MKNWRAETRDAGQLFPELESDSQRLLKNTTGILPSQQLEHYIKTKTIHSGFRIEKEQVQPASIDLRLGRKAYRVQASFLPGKKSTVASKIDKFRMHEIDLSAPTVLEKGCVYIVRLMEELSLPTDIWGKANPKSTTGRLDIFTRLISDYSTEFEAIPLGYKGPLHIEIVPRTFSVLVHAGTKLNQLRLMRGKPASSDATLDDVDREDSLITIDGRSRGTPLIKNGLWISIDLVGATRHKTIGYRAKQHAPLVELDKVGFYDPYEFWDPVPPARGGTLLLNPNDFYILASKERIRVPPEFSASMVPYDPSVGEFRIHYAGFFDPGFGHETSGLRGARAVLEVRSHEVPFLLEDGQMVGRLVYERMLGVPEKLYGLGIGSSYQSQGLALSKQFKRFEA